MVNFGAGMDFLKEQSAAFGGGNRGSGFNKITWIKPGEQAGFYFITDMNQMLVPLIHGKTMPAGRSGKTWSKDVLCMRTSAKDETVCPMCEANGRAFKEADAKGVKLQRPPFPGPFPRMVGYVFAEHVIHTVKKDESWRSVRTPEGVGYLEQTRKIMLMVAGKELAQDMQALSFTGDPADEDFDPSIATLLDRSFIISKTADDNKTTTNLKPNKPIPAEGLPDYVREAVAALPPLVDTINKEFSDGYEPRTTTTTSAAEDVPTADDFAQGQDELEEVAF